ncbi:MAG: hypothetical protein ACFBSG_02875 [Leptolyngbyaceae cyanobacterium]
MSDSSFSSAERLESAKVAITGGLATGVISLGLILIHRRTEMPIAMNFVHLWTSLLGLTLLINWLIVALSGSLFALTYRYAIRQDDNVQLKAGVVAAFTLVRGLAQVDAGSAIAQHFWPFLAACGESLLFFGVSAAILNVAFAQNWLKRFGK